MAVDYSKEDHKILLKRIREDNSLKSLTGIAHALGIPLPDKLFSNSKAYDRADEDIKRIKDRIKKENREATKAEKENLNRLEEVMAKTEGAHKLLEKFGPNISKVGVKVAKASVSMLLLSKTLGKISNSGKEATARINDTQKSMNSFGKSINDANLNVIDLQNQISGTSAQIKKNIQENFSGFYEGWLMFKNWGLSAIEKITGFDVNANTDENVGTNGKYGKNSYYSDPNFKDYINGVHSKGWGSRITDEQLYSIFGSVGDALIPAGNGLDSVSLAAKALTTSYLNSDRYRLDPSGESTVKNLQEIAGLIANGGNNASLGINVDSDTVSGYAADRLGINLANTTMSEAEMQRIRFRMIEEQLRNKNRDSLQKEIAGYKELGMTIEEAADKLFSFDQAEVLGVVDSSIGDLKDWGIAELGTDKEMTESIKNGLQESANMWSDSMLDGTNRVNDAMLNGTNRTVSNVQNGFSAAINNMNEVMNTMNKYQPHIGASVTDVMPDIPVLVHPNGLTTVSSDKLNNESLGSGYDRSWTSDTVRKHDKPKNYASDYLGRPTLSQNTGSYASGYLGGKVKPQSSNKSGYSEVSLLIDNKGFKKYASGGMTTAEQIAIMGDNPSHKEIALPLDSPTTQTALTDALLKAGANTGENQYVTHVHLDGLAMFNNEEQVNQLAIAVSDAVALRMQRGG